MFVLYADKNKLTVRQREPITSGSVNVCTVRFEFSGDWDGLTGTAVFRAGAEVRSVLLDGSGVCSIPWETLQTPWVRLTAGVCGTRDGNVVLPTVWADLGVIQAGAAPGGNAGPPTPELWEQALSHKQDKLTGLPGQVVGFDEAGNAAPQVIAAVGEGGPAWLFGHGLKQTGNLVSVDTADGFDGDNTLPITAAAVQTAVGNIETLLETI